MSVINCNKTLYELTKINESLNNINININNKPQQKINSINTLDFSNNNNYKNDFSYSQNSILNTLYNINKGIDSVYDNIKLMKGNKINSRVLYNINNSTQTYEDI